MATSTYGLIQTPGVTTPPKIDVNGLLTTTKEALPGQYTGAGYTPTIGESSAYSPTNWNVDQPQTVQGQIKGIIDADSPLMERAETLGKQRANKLGLMNSTLGIQSAEAALYDASLPIAQQDASTYASSGQFNASAANTADQFSAANKQQMELANVDAVNLANRYTSDATNQSNQFNAANVQQANLANTDAANALIQQRNEIAFNQASANLDSAVKMKALDITNAFQAAMQNADAQTKAYLAELDASTRTGLATIEANYKTLMETSNSAASMYQNVLGLIAQTAADPNMDAASKAATITALQSYLQNGLSMIGNVNGVDLTGILNFGTVPTTTTTTPTTQTQTAVSPYTPGTPAKEPVTETGSPPRPPANDQTTTTQTQTTPVPTGPVATFKGQDGGTYIVQPSGAVTRPDGTVTNKSYSDGKLIDASGRVNTTVRKV